LVRSGELLEELRGGYQAIWQDFCPLALFFLVSSDEKLPSFCVENGGNFVNKCFFYRRVWFIICFFSSVVCGKISGISSDDIECTNCDNLSAVGEVHCFCYSYSYAQACEAARPNRYIDMVGLLWLSAEAVQEAMDGRE